MRYELCITKLEPLTEEQIEKERRFSYPMMSQEPPRSFNATRSLTVTITEEEFEVIKRALVEYWK